MKLTITILFLSILNIVSAQDTVKTLSEKQAMAIVKQFHPVAKQADINIEKSKSGYHHCEGHV